MSRHGYRGDGAYGQFCVVLPEHDVVLALTGQSLDMQKVLDLAWEHLLPAFGGADTVDVGGAAADAALQQRLSAPSLPPVPNSDAIPPLTSGSFGAAHGNDHPTLSRITLEADELGWALTLHDADDRIEIVPGLGTWNVIDVMAVSAGWISSGSLAVDVIFIETPHRLQLVLNVASSTFTAKWATHPLDQRPLREIRMPRPELED